MQHRLRVTASLASLCLVACGGGATAAETTPSPTAGAPERPPRPRLVVSVVLDQLGYATLERYLPHLPEDGLLRRLADEGAYHRVSFQHSATYTAAGHASIYTGVSPREHGVMSNQVYHPERGEIASCDDGSCAVFGFEDRFASPSILRVPTVADALRDAHPDARVVAISYKDRGSVIPGGQRPDAVAFWDKERGRFTSSSFYGDAMPAWLDAFAEAHPAAEAMTVWEPGDPELLERVVGPDERAGESGLGFDATFPHDPNEAGEVRAASAFRATPQASEYLLELARAAVEAFDLGEDEVPDLLAVSVSGTDYVGHVFGNASWEYLDNLIRVDRALGRFVRELEAERGPVAVLVTSDHGHADVPQALEGGGRLVPAQLVARLEAAIDEAVGEGDWVLSYTEPFVYLSPAALEPEARAQVMPVVTAQLAEVEGIARAYDVATVRGWTAEEVAATEDPLDDLVYESVADAPPGHVFVVLSPNWIVDDEPPLDAGASHGTPYAYDREVPALFTGPGVTRARTDTPQDQRRVGRTLGVLLGLEGPGEAPRAPLEGAPVF